MGHMHWQSGSQTEAVGAWVMVYLLAKRTGLPGGLDGWEALARQLDDDG